MSLWVELKRRNVFKVAVAYAVVGWLVVQVADTVLPIFEAPYVIVQVFTFFVFLGFPLALVLSWAYELTPDGVRRADPVPSGQGGRHDQGRHFGVLVAGLSLGAVLGGGSVWYLNLDNAERLNIETLKNQIGQHIQLGSFEAAYNLVKQLEESAPEDVELDAMWSAISLPHSIATEPSGARVYRLAYEDVEGEWEDIGTTPIQAIRLPQGLSRLRFELTGYETVYRTALTHPYSAQLNMTVTLDESGSLPEGMVRVPGWAEGAASDVTGLDATVDAVGFDDFFLGRYEVTNADYKAFVDAGGYRRQEFWQHVIVDDGEEIPWDQAVERFVDRTGRPGPGTWEAGDYEDGQGNYPVTGVSWYEAAAYAQFARRELPTVYHWRRAFMSGAVNGLPWITPASNLESEAPAPVGEGQAMSWSGAFDMVGNAREWTFNAKGDGRFILGGGWNDPHYVGVDTNFVQPPLDRSSTNGFRLAITRDAASVTARARAPLADEDRDFTAEPPISDELFETYQRIFSYDRTPLNALVEGKETTRAWTRERISFDAAYGGERMILYLFLPTTSSPPYQTVVYWPGLAFVFNSIDQYQQEDFLLRDGRAIAFPVYKGNFERGDRSPYPNPSSAAARDLSIQWINDMRRSIDYLETRTDIDPERLAFFGLSWGAEKAPLALSMEPRLRAAVVHLGGVFYNLSLMRGRPLPEIDPATYLPRVNVPVLMLNGEFDSIVPFEASARPFFEMLGTSEADKKLVMAPGGHYVPREILISETLEWLDKYFGPVAE